MDTWTRPLRLSAEWGFRPDIFADNVGRVHAVWTHDSGVVYAYREDSGWSDRLLVVPGGAAHLPRIDGEGSHLYMIWRQDWAIWYSEHELAGVEEKRPIAHARLPTASTYRAVLAHQQPVGSSRLSADLIDITGRRVTELKAGENDIRHLAPGVYFVREEGSRGQGSEGSSVRKVVIQR